jgi:hypothetical protein
MAWTFRDFVTDRGENVIKEWLDGLPDKKAKAKINALLSHLEAESLLRPPEVKKIVGFDGIYEVCLVRQNTQYRPLGCYGPGETEFSLLVGAIERGDRITPPSAFQTAVDRRRLIQGGRSATCEHDFS